MGFWDWFFGAIAAYFGLMLASMLLGLFFVALLFVGVAVVLVVDFVCDAWSEWVGE